VIMLNVNDDARALNESPRELRTATAGTSTSLHLKGRVKRAELYRVHLQW
jgi:hypothetical protein